MAIRIKADDRVTDAMGDEEIYLPGPVKGADEEGPFEFVFPRVGRLIRLQRRLKGLNMAEAASEEIDGTLEWLAKGFGPDAWAHIDARLADEEDLLDEEHMVRLFQLLNERDTGTGRLLRLPTVPRGSPGRTAPRPRPLRWHPSRRTDPTRTV